MTVFEFRQWIESSVSVQQVVIAFLLLSVVVYFTIRFSERYDD